MQLIQMIIICTIYFLGTFIIALFLQGLIYQTTGFSPWNWLIKKVNKVVYGTVESTNNKRKLKYLRVEIYRKVV